MKIFNRQTIKLSALPCGLVAVLSLGSCAVIPPPGPHAEARMQAGYYDALPSGFDGDYYYYGGRYYYGGNFEPGVFVYNGRNYDGRYFHNGRYLYGGAHQHFSRSEQRAFNQAGVSHENRGETHFQSRGHR